MYFLILASFILISPVSPCTLLDGIRGGIDAIRGEVFKQPRFGTMEGPKPLFIVKRLGQPPTLIQNPDLKSDSSVRALAEQVSMVMGQQLGLDSGSNFGLATQEMGKELQQYLGPEIFAKPFKLGTRNLPSTFSLPPFPDSTPQQQNQRQQLIDTQPTFETQPFINGQQRIEVPKTLPFM